MKFAFNTKAIIFSLFFVTLLFNNYVNGNPEEKTNTPAVIKIPEASIKSISDLKEMVLELAREKMKSSNVLTKAKSVGVLPQNSPAHMKKRAQFSRNNLDIFGNVMSYPIDIYRSCIYPVAKINYRNWCKNVNFGHPDKIVACQISFCNVCCDNLAIEYEEIAKENRFATNLGMTTNDFIQLMKDHIVKTDQIQACKNKCVKVYPAQLPSVQTAPTRDPTLGTKENPGRDCMDIKVWGSAENKSGKYWIKFGLKGNFETYCDMETDNGGWTLFFNYKHAQGQELFLNATVSVYIDLNNIMTSF